MGGDQTTRSTYRLVMVPEKTTIEGMPYHELDLSHLPVVFGRAADAAASGRKRGWSNNLHRVSQIHLHILEPSFFERQAGVAIKVVDQSHGGTWIDEKLIPKKKPVPVKVGQRLTVGPWAYLVERIESPLDAFLDKQAPEDLLCPISLSLLMDPVILAADGITYSRAAIQQHLDNCRASTL